MSSVSSDENKTLGGGTVDGRLRRRWGCRRFAFWLCRILQFFSYRSRSCRFKPWARRFERPRSRRFECHPQFRRHYSLQAMRLARKRVDLEVARRKRYGARSRRSTASRPTFDSVNQLPQRDRGISR